MRLRRRLARALLDEHPDEAARQLELLTPTQAAATLQSFEAPSVAEVLRRMETGGAAACLASIDDELRREVIGVLPPDHGARIVARLDAELRERILADVDDEIVAPLRRLLERPEGSAGALMDPRPPAVPVDLTRGEARRLVQRHPRDLLYYLYLVDREQRLVGVLSLRDLLAGDARQPLREAMRAPVQRLSADTAAPAIVNHPGWQEFHAMPVVDEQEALVGVMRYETLRRLESDANARPAPVALTIGLALGEIYWDLAARVLFETLDLARGLTRSDPPSEVRHGA